MITPLAAGVLTAECLSWFVVVARYDLIMYLLSISISMPKFYVCMSLNFTILKELGRRKSKRKSLYLLRLYPGSSSLNHAVILEN